MKHKKGFSLAEVLLALGIISVIVTMGMTISKKGFERAHNLYYYTGYSSLVDAISDVSMNDTSSQNDIKTNFKNFGDELIKRFSGAAGGVTEADGRYQIEIRTKNGISYYIQCPQAEGASCGEYSSYLVTMYIPQIDNSGDYTMFIYIPGSNDGSEGESSGSIYPIEGGLMNLQTRTDIVPFYIDDGKVGRNRLINYIPDPTENDAAAPTFEKRIFRSFIDAYCDRFGTTIEYQNSAVVSCTGKDSPTKTSGVLRFENPQKVF